MSGTVFSPTAYDDVFRTLLNDCRKLIIPVINEMFGESYTGEETIQFLPNEHFLNQQDGEEKKRITDTSFAIIGSVEKRYHLECESTLNNRILIRIFEYDAQIALDQNSDVLEDKIIVSFPNTAILYLRSTKTTPDKMKIEIRTPGGNTSYDVPVMKVKNYSIDEIFEKKLLFLIPFYIFSFEADFPRINDDGDLLEALKSEYERIALRLEDLVKAGELEQYDKKAIMEMGGCLIGKLAQNYTNIEKGVGAIMRGKILEYEAKDIRNKAMAEGEAKGRAEGEAKGRAEGEAKTFDLISKLVALGRMDDVKKAAGDEEARKLLFAEFKIG